DPPATGHCRERLVEAQVGGTDFLPAALPGGLLALPHGGLGGSGTGRRLGDLADDAAFQQRAHAVDLRDIVSGEHPDEDAAVELVHDQAFVAEYPESLAQRVPGDIERGAHEL